MALRARNLAAIALAIGCVVPATAEAAAPAAGTLSYLGCIEASAGPDECSATGVGLGEPTAIAAAPGSTSLYAGSEDDTAVTPLARAGDGRLSTLPCIQGPPATVCPTTTDGLIGSPNAVAVSPDGAQVYAVSSQNIATGAIAFLNRAADGTLSSGGCLTATNTACGTAVTGLASPADIVVSPDGANVYVVTGQGSFGASAGTIVSFARAADGTLTPLGCIANQGNNICGAGNTTPGLAGVGGVAISPDGTSVYASARSPDADPNTSGATGALISFQRGPGGALTPAGCIAETGSAVCGAGNTSAGLRGPADVTVSADGATVYVAAGNFRLAPGPLLNGDDAAVTAFRRDANGALTPLGCVAQTGSGECGGATMEGLRRGVELAASADGHDLYVAGRAGFPTATEPGALAQLVRGADGSLTPGGCYAGPATTLCGADRALPGLGHPTGVAITPDDTGVYVTGLGSDAIAEFGRALAPPSNEFSFVKVKRNRAKGIAKLIVEIPGPGELALAKTGKVKPATKQAQAGGKIKLKVKPRGKAKRALTRADNPAKAGGAIKVKVKAKVTYTPTGGDPNTKTKSLKLIRKR